MHHPHIIRRTALLERRRRESAWTNRRGGAPAPALANEFGDALDNEPTGVWKPRGDRPARAATERDPDIEIAMRRVASLAKGTRTQPAHPDVSRVPRVRVAERLWNNPPQSAAHRGAAPAQPAPSTAARAINAAAQPAPSTVAAAVRLPARPARSAARRPWELVTEVEVDVELNIDFEAAQRSAALPEQRAPRPVTAVEPPVRLPSRAAPAGGTTLRSSGRRTRRLALALGVVAAAATAGGATQLVPEQLRPMVLATDETPSPAPPGPRLNLAPPETSRARFRGVAASVRDVWREADWHHPLGLTGGAPNRSTRVFGANRDGHRPPECGAGHCGVDIGERGMLVHAVRSGRVERVQRRNRGRTGRYVRIGHDDGLVTYYLHLDRVRDDLEVGMWVQGAEEIGVVGRSGIRRTSPHLHFAMAVRVGRKHYFIDPEPMLHAAEASDEVVGVVEVVEPDLADELAEPSRPRRSRRR